MPKFCLTTKEAKIHSLIISGQNAQEVCEQLGIALSTFRVHCRNIRIKGFEDSGAIPTPANHTRANWLTDKQESALYMRHVRRLSYNDIALNMGIAKQTAQNLVCRAMNTLGLSGVHTNSSSRRRAVLSALDMLTTSAPSPMADPMF